jgi:hypothetical protein
MSRRWENVLALAREIERAMTKGESPEMTSAERLARSVIELQKWLAGPQQPNLGGRWHRGRAQSPSGSPRSDDSGYGDSG